MINRELAYYKLALICEQLTIEQVMWARRHRNWRKFDRLTENEKLLVRLEELEIYQDDIDPEYIPKGPYGEGTDI
jgi:hypothetical protein